MKKVKIMLTAVLVLGTVGGVLAYKANMKRISLMCVRATNAQGQCPAGLACTAGVIGRLTAAAQPGFNACTVAFESGVPCSQKVCATLTRYTFDQPQ